MSTSLLCSKAYQITNAKRLRLLRLRALCGKNGIWSCWQPGRAKSNGTRKTITSRIWIESTACRPSSSGQYSQESQRWASSRRFKVQWEPCSVNPSTSMTGSSSCQCTTTLRGEQKETQKDVNTIHRQLQIVPANSLAVIGLYWGLDQKRNGTELTLTNSTDPGSNCREHDEEFLRIGSSIISCLQCLWKRRITKQRRRQEKKSLHFNGSDENIVLLLRTVISANQLSVCGAIEDLCNESPKDLRTPEKPAAPDHKEKMEIPTGLSAEETQTKAQQRRNLVQEYERKFEQLSEDQTLYKLCSDAGLKLVETGQYLFSLDTEEGPQMQLLCREETRARGWFLKNTRIGPVLNIRVCRHEDRYSIEVLVQSLFQDRTASWVGNVNGVDKYVTESMLTKKEQDIASVKPIAKARPRPFLFLFLKGNGSTLKHNDHTIKSVLTCQKPLPDCYDMIKQSLEGCTEQYIQYNDIIEDASRWLLDDWFSTLAKREGAKKRFQYCVNPNSSNQFLYLRAIQGHSGDNVMGPALQDNTVLPKGFTDYIYHVGNASDLNSMIRNGLIPGGKSLKRGRQAVFFATVNPMDDGYGMEWNSMRSDKSKDRAIQEYLDTPSKYSILVQFEARSRERLAILPNTATRSRSPRHTTHSLHWESVMYEDTGGALQEGSPHSESTTYRTEIELAIWSTRSTKPRRKIIFGTTERFEKLRVKSVTTPWIK